MRGCADEDVSGADGGTQLNMQKEYYIDCIYSPYDGKEITAEEYTVLETASIELRKLLFEIDYFPIVIMNNNEFTRYCDCLKDNNTADFINLNRLFANWINSFYMWIEYHEKHYNILFGRLKSAFYDSDFSYRFAYNLRQFTTHNTMPITKMKTDLISGEICFLIDAKPMWEKSSGVQSIFAKELSQNSMETIDAYQMAKAFVPMFQTVQKNLWDELQPSLCETLMSVHCIVPVTDSSFCNAYVHRESDQTFLPIGHQMKFLLDKSKATGFDFYRSFREKVSE